MGVELPYSKISKGAIGDALKFGYCIVSVNFEGVPLLCPGKLVAWKDKISV
jgi:hypothetical protein